MTRLPSFFENRILLTYNSIENKKHSLKIKEGDIYNNFIVTSEEFLNIRIPIESSNENRKTRSEWYINVDCSCGNNLWVKYGYLKTLKFKSCCKCRAIVREGKYKSLESMRVWHTRCSSIKKSAKKQNIFFDLTPLYLKELFELQENTCGITGDIILNTKGNISLDKKDPKLGYIKGNVQWTNRKSNMMKQDLSMEELIEWCEKVLIKNKIPSDFRKNKIKTANYLHN